VNDPIRRDRPRPAVHPRRPGGGGMWNADGGATSLEQDRCGVDLASKCKRAASYSGLTEPIPALVVLW
jgi:hypothetical protein